MHRDGAGAFRCDAVVLSGDYGLDLACYFVHELRRGEGIAASAVGEYGALRAVGEGAAVLDQCKVDCENHLGVARVWRLGELELETIFGWEFIAGVTNILCEDIG